MHVDRYTKIVLTVIALGLWALMLAEVGLPDFISEVEATAASPSATTLQSLKKPGGEAGTVRAATATLPLRWRVSWAAQYVADTTNCGTAIIVTNDTSSSVTVEVEWFSWYNSSEGLGSLAIAGQNSKVWVSGRDWNTPSVDYRPFVPDHYADAIGFAGYARVHATDPRIEVAAFQYCRDGLDQGKNIMSITNIPAFPVGATAEFFQAGMPATWMPPIAAPESSQ